VYNVFVFWFCFTRVINFFHACSEYRHLKCFLIVIRNKMNYILMTVGCYCDWISCIIEIFGWFTRFPGCIHVWNDLYCGGWVL